MKQWVRLYRDHASLREGSGEALPEIRKRLKELADRGHCDGSIVGRFTASNHENRRLWKLIGKASGEKQTLEKVPPVEHVSLTVLAMEDARSHHLHQFTAILEGVAEGGRPWLVAVHLEDDQGDSDRKGAGACRHAAYHCHVGPDFEAPPKIRVPLPAIGPVEALDWLLSTIVPNWEPAPWPEVLGHIAAAQHDEIH